MPPKPGYDVLVERLDSIKGDIDRRFNETTGTLTKIETKLSDDYVTRKEIQPVIWITYGMVSVILTGFIGTLLTLVWKSQ